EDFHYEYTECDSHGGRWRVSVPEPGKCIDGAPNAPVRGKDCSFTCKEGEYLDLEKQECEKCPAGTYSLGGGLRFDDWEKLPSGFTITTEGFQGKFLWHNQGEDVNCSKSTWQPRGSYIAALPGDCTTILVFSTKLVKAGAVQFEYQYTDPDIIFHFMVQNDQCQAAGDDDASQWPKVTEEGQWRKQSVNLKSGMNVIQWRTIGVLSDLSPSKQIPILIRNIEISGVAYTSECTKCRNGTYSSGGNNFCADCPKNTFSHRGEGTCQPCDTAIQYSLPGATKCLIRPACKESDYFEHQTPCENKKTFKTYTWIKPENCNPGLVGSVKLPQSDKPTDCPPCNPGMHLVEDKCEFCPVNMHSDGKEPCTLCPASTSPVYSIDYRWWNTMPPNITSTCLSMTDENCSEQVGWLTNGDHLQTNFGHDENIFIILTLNIDGLRGSTGSVDGKAKVLGQISFMFDLDCEVGQCELVFLSNESGRNSIVSSWQGTTNKQPYVHKIRTNKAVSFTWAFQPADWDTMDPDNIDISEYLNNKARIYSIQVTNTLSGGAVACKACPRGTQKDGCIPCPDGNYIDPKTTKCTPCPSGTVMASGDPWGKQACEKCGVGLKPVHGHHCASDCKITDSNGKTFDFSKLNGLQYVTGTRLFTSSGTTYFHGFNISLCDNKVLPSCVNNVTSLDEEMFNEPSTVSGMICRSTMVPSKDKKTPNSIVSTQPVSIGDHLVQIVSNSSLKSQYIKEGFNSEKINDDIHFYFKSESATAACPNGRETIITLSCDVNEKGQGQLELPPKCSDGTCDGCNFHFMWYSQHACPLCQEKDYEVVNGECKNGEQTIHYYPPKNCLIPFVSKPRKMVQKCSTLPLVVQISIPVAVGVGLLLLVLLVYCWKRNKKLEYRYMKLVETAGGKDGELPAAESCGLDEGEDEDTVH
ncbi:hypothetical protein LOTGIDRAFT_81462, partial [Lottia gigantea]